MSEAMRAATHARHYAEPPQATDSDGTRHARSELRLHGQPR
jgi:hypothetical protein